MCLDRYMIELYVIFISIEVFGNSVRKDLKKASRDSKRRE